MNMATPNMNTARRQLAQRLKEVTRDFQFRWGEPANCGDDRVCVALDDEWDENDQLEYLVSVFAPDAPLECLSGLPWTVRQSLTREVVKEGQTDRYGCFRLRGLPDGDYALELGDEAPDFDPAAARPITAGKIHTLIAPPVLSAKERVFEQFHSADEAIVGTVRGTPRGLVLTVQIRLELIRSLLGAEGAVMPERGLPAVARFDVFGQSPSVGVEDRPALALLYGYVGLYPDGGNTAVGEIFLERLPARIQTVSGDYHFVVRPMGANELTPAARPDLEHCRDASEGRSREALDNMLHILPDAE